MLNPEKRYARAVQLLIIALVVDLLLGYWVFFILRVSNEQARYYLLSGISQGLAAILGIGLTAALVLGQVLSTYSPGMRVPLGWLTITYLLMYVVGIILPLSGLLSSRWEWMVRPAIEIAGFQFSIAGVSLWWGAFCLSLLPAYLFFLKEYMSPRGWLDRLEREANHIKKLSVGRRREHYINYATIALNALQSKDYPTFRGALDHLCDALIEHSPQPDDVPHEVWDFYPQDEKEQWKAILKQIVHINLEAIHGPAAFTFKSAAYRRMGTKAAIIGPQQGVFTACQAVALLDKSGDQAIGLAFEGPAVTIMSDLGGLAEEALKNEQHGAVVNRAVAALDNMVMAITKKWDFEQERYRAVRHGIFRIAFVGEAAIPSPQPGFAVKPIVHLGYLSRFFFDLKMEKHRNESLAPIGKIGISAVNNGVWGVAKHAIYWMTQNVIWELSSDSPDGDVLKHLLLGLRRIGMNSLANCDEYGNQAENAVSDVIQKLEKILVEAWANSMTEVADLSQECVVSLGKKAAQQGHWETTERAMAFMARIMQQEIYSMSPNPGIIDSAARNVRNICIDAFAYYQSTGILNDTGIYPMINGLCGIAREAACLPSLEGVAIMVLNYIGKLANYGMYIRLEDIPVSTVRLIKGLQPSFARMPLVVHYDTAVESLKRYASRLSRADVIAELP